MADTKRLSDQLTRGRGRSKKKMASRCAGKIRIMMIPVTEGFFFFFFERGMNLI